ncbi:MAG: DNA primase [bacterium]
MKTGFPDYIIDEIRQKTDIAALIAEDVLLKKTGRNLTGLCPFHSERTPSFTVSPDKQIYYCFGCGAGGDVFSFLMQRRGLSFPEAVKFLAERSGVNLPDEAGSAEEKARQKALAELYRVNEMAMQYFSYNLTGTKQGTQALAYLRRRGVTADSIEIFRLGWALPAWEGLLAAAREKDCPAELLAKAGLVSKRQQGDGYYDRFRGRLMFPIFDLTGKVIGFGGRVLDDSTPKYLNSPETPLFEKGKNLYAFHLARPEIRRRNQAIVMEGYMDVIAAHQSGVGNAVASLGTALTADQGRTLHRYGQDIVIAYDADAAGAKATVRGLELLTEIGCNVRVAELPPGDDPDAFIRRKGKEAFGRLLERALSLTDYKLKLLFAANNHSSIEGRTNIIKQAAPIISALTSSSEQELYIRALAKRLEVTEEALRTDIRRYGEDKASSDARGKDKSWKTTHNRKEQPVVKFNNRSGAGTMPAPAHIKAEKLLLRLMLDNSKLLETVRGELGPEAFSESAHREIVRVILRLAEDGARVDPAKVLTGLTEASAETRQKASEIFMAEFLFPIDDKVITDNINTVKANKLNQEIAFLLDQVRLCESQGDNEKRQLLLKRIDALQSARGR